MGVMRERAERFFEACETGKGWEVCRQYCHAGATFSAQAQALAGVATLEGYTEWMKGLLTPIPDGRYEIRRLPRTRAERTWPRTVCSGARTPGRVGRCQRRGSEWRRTTSTS